MRILFFAAAAALCATAARAVEPMPDVAPLGLRTQGTLRELFLDVTGADARPATALGFDVRWSMANDWNMPTSYQRGTTTLFQELDEQADSVSVSARVPWARFLGAGPTVIGGRPLWERLSTTFELRATLHWGGWSDGAIERWHDVSGAFNFERAAFPRNQVNVHLDGAFDVRSSRLALGDLVVRNQLTLFEGGMSAGALAPDGELRPAWAVALRFDIKAPTGLLSRLGGSGGWDAALTLAATVEVTHWLTLHGLASASAFSRWSTDVALQPKTWHATAELSAVATVASWAFFVEDRAASPLLVSGWSRQEAMGNDGFLASSYAADFRAQNQLSFGLRRRGLSVWMSEDFTPGPNPRSTLRWLYNTNAPDVVIGVSYRAEL